MERIPRDQVLLILPAGEHTLGALWREALSGLNWHAKQGPSHKEECCFCLYCRVRNDLTSLPLQNYQQFS